MENCLDGYNSSILAYGQTGSGKTYTMLGELPQQSAALPPEVGLPRHACRGYPCDSTRPGKVNDGALQTLSVLHRAICCSRVAPPQGDTCASTHKTEFESTSLRSCRQGLFLGFSSTCFSAFVTLRTSRYTTEAPSVSEIPKAST